MTGTSAYDQLMAKDESPQTKGTPGKRPNTEALSDTPMLPIRAITSSNNDKNRNNSCSSKSAFWIVLVLVILSLSGITVGVTYSCTNNTDEDVASESPDSLFGSNSNKTTTPSSLRSLN